MIEIEFRLWMNGEYIGPFSLGDYHLQEELDNGPDLIEQFTGLKDKNNKKIFEGDILKTKNYFGEGIGIVKNGTWSFHIQDIKSSSELVWGSPEGEHWIIEETEIIGNIKENSEILND
jgi:uncharacterized phage protein (TIGR01671 family)